MIPEAAVKALARRQRVDPAVIDRDHALGVVLSALNPHAVLEGWVFKGGTCLRKCHFGDYRFSEDLDFTVTSRLDVFGARSTVVACGAAAAAQGVQLVFDDMRVEVMDDEYGRESIEIKVPYRGALRMGSAQNVQFHLSADEDLAFDTLSLPLLHPYDDAQGLGCDIRTYALEEILAEKLRAAAGQRRYAVARDIYDIASLVRRGADKGQALSALPRKAERKGLDLSGAATRFRGRRSEFEVSWERTLKYLVFDATGFEEAFSITADLLGDL